MLLLGDTLRWLVPISVRGDGESVNCVCLSSAIGSSIVCREDEDDLRFGFPFSIPRNWKAPA